jgi:hypothetical protein
MGYSHSWHAVFEGNLEAFAAIRGDFEKLILPLADLGYPIAGPDGTGIPDITDTHIHFSGVRHCGHTEPKVFVAALTIAAPLLRRFVPFRTKMDAADFG